MKTPTQVTGNIHRARTKWFRPIATALQIKTLFIYAGLLVAALYLISIGARQRGYNFGFGDAVFDGACVLCVVLIGGAAFTGLFAKRFIWVKNCVYALILIVSCIRFAEIGILRASPVSNALDQLLWGAVQPMKMGLVAAIPLFFLSLGVLSSYRYKSAAIVLILSSLCFPLVSLLALSYNNFGGYAMIPVSMSVVLFLLGLAELLLLARAPLLRPFLTTYSWGRLARLQLLSLSIGAWFLGYIVLQTGRETVIEPVIIGMLWLFLVTILSTGFVFEKVDRQRRVQERDMKRKANFDPLTGLWNRRAVRDMRMFRRTIAGTHLVNTHDHVGVILADVDMFKRINDVSGHDEGDRVLREISRVLCERVRGLDVVARWGGEEFLILLPNLSARETMKVAQVLRVAIATSVCWSNVGRNDPVTMSIGVSSLSKAGEKTLEGAIQEADDALFSAKSRGKNCVVLFGQELPERAADLVTTFTSKRALH
ncbi:diguanylate cyclase (GGDEF)-like protein [Pacificibacter maritimus]|uniref:diguanylate cyclase n=1 Tax=Pacificibacter maritimus TaxID=762213 RepID=A0A3N4UVW6_9RHOB|nr:GGDEF domain-containing protein [Pacificibacter maritimus]RPE71639.1 diguanylate cyclase (GGDEF)-like protein [Pacificibacter maritimus]